MPSATPAKFRFGSFELDAVTGELRKSGVLLKLQPQPFRVLNVYVFWGLHVSSYRKPAHKSNLKVQGALANSFLLLRNSESTGSNDNTKEHRSSAIGFLWHEMMKNAFGGRSFKPADIKPWTEVDNERHGSISQHDFSRGVNEIELETETELRLGDAPTEN